LPPLGTMNIIQLKNFIQATRDSGYGSVSQALAEIIDNSVEAAATVVRIDIKRTAATKEFEISIMDNGFGMSPAELANAIRFGGTDRFNSRKQYGRYGMGLPNSSLSQCRRLEVYTWRKKPNIYWNFLDVDGVISGEYEEIIPSKRRRLPDEYKNFAENHGALVLWKNIDRIGAKSLAPLTKRLHYHLGQIFRKAIYDGVNIQINGESLNPFDPLYLQKGINPIGGESYGEPMVIPVRLGKITSEITVKFSELPVVKWSPLSNKQKREMRITKNSGVSILRHGREIDAGWHFMGSKRRENYDDWWRCEVSFESALDDLFGITHTKQMVNPTSELREILEPHIEAVAHKLNYRVREKFIFLSQIRNKPEEILMAQANDHLVEPAPESVHYNVKKLKLGAPEGKFSGYKYQVTNTDISSTALYNNELKNDILAIKLNNNHPFFMEYLTKMEDAGSVENSVLRKIFYLIILALARSEYLISKKIALSYRLHWGNTIKKYLAS
jgi:hypothetical protein